jgi:hydrogenase-4 membrane subunit HyfE
MTYLLLTFLFVLLGPLLTGNWKISMLALSAQGLLLGWMALHDVRHVSVDAVFAFVELILVRGLVVPRILYRILGAQGTATRNDVIPANFLSWSLAGGLVFLAFRFGGAVAGGSVLGTTHAAVAGAALLLGFLVLASGSTPASQIIGLLRIENAISLFALLLPAPHPLVVEVGVLLVSLGGAWFLVTFLAHLSRLPAPVAPEEERPTL